ncbi:hypothetical protein RE6C_01373 [Rhodopirellula europaea 6C]|uniref:Uncharacterized protein n=1 Tax=Rhodopirellula europaea 6C TaxID=1263867 RepID=M2AZ01_9BACT|nr:hypothetical protein RE6C_01373 [Rhodopirellula europaea 6C]
MGARRSECFSSRKWPDPRKSLLPKANFYGGFDAIAVASKCRLF